MRFLRKIFNIATLTGTIAIFAFMFLLQTIAVNFDFLNIFEQTINNFKISDVYFSQIRDNKTVKGDTNVVIVNIGYLPRAGLGAQIEIISRYSPKVIGLDALLEGARQPEQDSTMEAFLQIASQRCPIVFASKLEKPNEETKGFDSLGLPHKPFQKYIQTGYVNVVTDEDTKFETARIVSPKEKVIDSLSSTDSIEYSFATKLVQIAYPKKAEKLLARGNDVETIYYRGDYDKFMVLNPMQVLEENFDPSVFKDKIVIMGYMGEDYNIDDGTDDRYYTPMNSRPVGRAATDMYGIMIHANMISMIMHENYIDVISPYLAIFLSVLLCFANVVLFTYIYFHRKLGTWYDVITKGVQLVEVIIFVFIFISVLANYNYMMELTVGVLAVVLSGDVLEVFLAILANVYPKSTRAYE
ncbi:CHASE2 domain-containing protein [Bernardetia sp.]|uniref:CHASE2 domain-containing protein n=1 Tax=Bernardetia sp. TaxID=1937974 RepID=UPI0025BEB82B|nr:CHASE2 domain-containing protein [Bernardetia sp.]